MTVGESTLNVFIHVFVIIAMQEILLFYNDLNLRHISLLEKDRFKQISAFCQYESGSHLKKYSFPLSCNVDLQWIEHDNWASPCNSLSRHKTYPRRWYRIEGKCSLLIGDRVSDFLQFESILKI